MTGRLIVTSSKQPMSVGLLKLDLARSGNRRVSVDGLGVVVALVLMRSACIAGQDEGDGFGDVHRPCNSPIGTLAVSRRSWARYRGHSRAGRRVHRGSRSALLGYELRDIQLEGAVAQGDLDVVAIGGG